MKKITDAERERIAPSIEIARRFVDSEDRLQKLEAMNAPAVIIENEKKLLAKLRKKLAQDPVAGKLLFQVRARIKQLRKRRDAIRATKLGELSDLADDLYCSLGPDQEDMETAPESFEELWQMLKKGLSSEGSFALKTLLADAVVSIEHTELPPLPEPIEVNKQDL